MRIPAGVGEGSRVRIPGEGEHGTSGAKSGDLYLRVRLAPHPKFEVKGKDLYTRVSVPLTTAVLGGEAQVDTLGGKPLRLKIPPGTQNGQVFRLKGHGMPTVNHPEQTGDLYATVAVQLPRDLTADQSSACRRIGRSRRCDTGFLEHLRFRAVATLLAAYLIRLGWVKLVGARYLLYLAIHHFSQHGGANAVESHPGHKRIRVPSAFWVTVIKVELTDIVFAIDSILASGSRCRRRSG